MNAGDLHTCGVTLAGRGFCWGRGEDGELGDGTVANQPRPVSVGGNLELEQISAGLLRTYAVTADDGAYGEAPAEAGSPTARPPAACCRCRSPGRCKPVGNAAGTGSARLVPGVAQPDQ